SQLAITRSLDSTSKLVTDGSDAIQNHRLSATLAQVARRQCLSVSGCIRSLRYTWKQNWDGRASGVIETPTCRHNELSKRRSALPCCTKLRLETLIEWLVMLMTTNWVSS